MWHIVLVNHYRRERQNCSVRDVMLMFLTHLHMRLAQRFTM